MIKLGEYQVLEIGRKKEFGLYLSDDEGNEVLLPKRYITEDMEIGGRVRVFVYNDSKDRPVATTEAPLITIDTVAALRVTDIKKGLGAFLYMGLDRDLFLPYKEMNGRIEVGDEILVRMYIDKTGRLCASMWRLYPLLSSYSHYRAGDEVRGRIYEFGRDFGTFVAVDDKYLAMLQRHEDVSHFRIGDVISARVTGVKEDGKLDLTMRKRREEQMDDDANKVLSIIESYEGVLPFTEKASPEVILRETGLSKAAFKRAIGRLYRERKINIDDGKILTVRGQDR